MLIQVHFEELLIRPRFIFNRLATLLSPWWSLDACAAARTIRERSPLCEPGLDIEISLMGNETNG